MRRANIITLTFMAAAACLLLAACNEYYDDLRDVGRRVERLEQKDLKQMETNLLTVQDLLSVMQGLDYITSIRDNGDGTFTLTFASDPDHPRTITSGADATDGTAVIIGVVEVDGVWYWTINGQTTGMRASKTDGNPGADSHVDPKDIPVPRVSVDGDGYWIYSLDGGQTWSYITDAEGNRIKANGDDGAPDSIFTTVVLSPDGKTATFVLTDGTVIVVDVRS